MPKTRSNKSEGKNFMIHRIFFYVLIVILLGGVYPSYSFELEAFYPEGPCVTKGGLYWAEMTLNRVRFFDGKIVQTVWEEENCGPTCIKKAQSGYWVLCHIGHRIVKLSNDFKKEYEVTKDNEGNPIWFPNDAFVDSKGQLFFTISGRFSLDSNKAGYVLFIDKYGKVRRLFGPIKYANGITYDEKSSTLFVSEHLARRILKLKLNNNFNVENDSVFFDFNHSLLAESNYFLSGPDGQLLLDNGDMIVANYGESRLIRISKNGEFSGMIPVKMKFVTNLAISPFDSNQIIVVGSFDNTKFPMAGCIISLEIDYKSMR